MKEKHVVSFSGGKDSTAMLLLMLEHNMPIDRIVFIDTTKEYPSLYDHIKKIEEHIYPLVVEKFKIDFDYWFFKHVLTKGKRVGQKGYGWPTRRSRWCTALKRATFKKNVYEKEYKIIEYHGISYDEQQRIKLKNDTRIIKHPLIDFKMTGKMALQYCYDKGFNWDGLYKKVSRVSCYCCPLSRLENLLATKRFFPELWEDMKRLDGLSCRPFKPDYTFKEIDELLEWRYPDKDTIQKNIFNYGEEDEERK